MNELYTREFVKQAAANGLPQQKIAAIINRAQQIAYRQTKTASAKSNQNYDLVGRLLKSAGMEKTASSVSFTHGILNEAFMNGANLNEALEFTKTALDASAKKIQFMQKVAAIANHPTLGQWAEGFLGSAKQAGMSQDDAVALMVDLVDKEKRAAGDDSAMFKQPSDGGAPAPEGDPSAGAPPMGAGGPPPGDPSGGQMDPTGGQMDPSGGQGQPGGGDAQIAQILQELQSLPPEVQQQVIQQLLSVMGGGGQGGPAGAPPGGPAGAPPPGAPPMGGPGGPPPPQGGPQGPV